MIYLTLFDHFLINLGYKIVKFKYLKLLTIYLLNNTLKKGNILKDLGGTSKAIFGTLKAASPRFTERKKAARGRRGRRRRLTVGRDIRTTECEERAGHSVS